MIRGIETQKWIHFYSYVYVEDLSIPLPLNPGRALKPICEDLEFWGKRLEAGRLRINMEMPGADKKDISLEMRKNSFCVSAPRGQDAEYSGCFKFAHEIVPEKTEAQYESGLLKIFAPIKDRGHGVDVTIR